MREIVLPSGKFCSISVATVGDMAAAFDGGRDGMIAMSILACRTSRVDGEPIDLAAFLKWEYAEALPIFHYLNMQIVAAHKTKEGIV